MTRTPEHTPVSTIDQQAITGIIRLVARRERMSTGLRWLSGAALALSATAVVLAIVDRAGSSSFLPWIPIAIAFGGVAVCLGLVGWWRCRPEAIETARQVDGRLGLKDRLATALICRERTDSFARALIQDAQGVAGSPATRESAKRRFRVSPPPFWWGTPTLILVALMVTFFGQWDLLRPTNVDEVDLAQVRNEAAQSVQATVEAIREDPALSEALQGVLEDLEASTAQELALREDEASIRREALKRVSALDRKLEELLNGPQGQAMRSMEEQLSQLDAGDNEQLQDLIDAMSKADFEGAQQQLTKLADTMASDDMSDSDRQALADALQALADQLKSLSEKQDALSESLKQAGLDPALANDPEALAEAIEQAEGLNESQKQSLKQQAQANQQAEQMLKKLAEATQQACNNCQNPGQQGEKSSCQNMAEQMSQLQQISDMLKKCESTRSKCQSQCNKLGQGLAKTAACQAPGSGGTGGQGSSAGAEETDTDFVRIDDSNAAGNGPVIASMPVQRDQHVGESTLTLTQAQQTAREGFDEALGDSHLPRQYREALKRYFGNQKAVEQAVESDARSADSTTPPSEAKPKSD